MRPVVGDAGRIQLRLWSQRDDRKVKHAPQSWSQPAETDRPRKDPGLCVPELSETVGSFKNKESNTMSKRKRRKMGRNNYYFQLETYVRK